MRVNDQTTLLSNRMAYMHSCLLHSLIWLVLWSERPGPKATCSLIHNEEVQAGQPTIKLPT